jgi:hypothetical protein
MSNEALRSTIGVTEPVATDILEDLKNWLAQLVADAPHRHGELPQIEINLITRAIREIERLRAASKDKGASP